VPRYRVDGFDLAPIAERRPDVEQHPVGGQPGGTVRVERRHRARPDGDRSWWPRVDRAGLQGSPGRRPGREAAVMTCTDSRPAHRSTHQARAAAVAFASSYTTTRESSSMPQLRRRSGAGNG